MGAELVARAASPAVRTRPEPSVWSALEYACHVRDALLVQRERVLLAQVEERPSFAPMYHDERVSFAGYRDEQPEDVADHLAVAAALVGRVLDGLTAPQRARVCSTTMLWRPSGMWRGSAGTRRTRLGIIWVTSSRCLAHVGA